MKYIVLIALFALAPFQCASADELLSAYWDGDSERVVKILKDTIPAGKEGFHDRSEALLVAAEYGDLQATKYLIENGVDLEVVDDSGKTPLLIAATEKRAQVGLYLIEAGANIEARDHVRLNTPLLLASEYGNFELVQALVEAGADINAKSYLGKTALNMAALPWSYNLVGGDNLIVYLIEKGLDINQRDSAGNTVLGDPLIQRETGATFDEIRATLARLGGKI